MGGWKGLGIECAEPLPDRAAAPVDGSVTARDETVEVAMDRFSGPVALGARKVGRCAAVEGRHRQDLRRREAVEVSTTCSREEVLQPVPVFAPQGDELLRSQSTCRTGPKLPDMQPLPDTDLVVATPERVSFDYQVPGLATRAIAHILHISIIFGILTAVFFLASAVSIVGSTGAAVVVVFGSFVVIFGYFWVSESLWSGQTIGKKAFRLRAVGDRGEPLTFAQAGIRNIVRIVDFLPYAYGVGLIVLFANGKGKRLGDLAAGTNAGKDSDHRLLGHVPRAHAPPDPSATGVAAAPAAAAHVP